MLNELNSQFHNLNIFLSNIIIQLINLFIENIKIFYLPRDYRYWNSCTGNFIILLLWFRLIHRFWQLTPSSDIAREWQFLRPLHNVYRRGYLLAPFFASDGENLDVSSRSHCRFSSSFCSLFESPSSICTVVESP